MHHNRRAPQKTVISMTESIAVWYSRQYIRQKRGRSWKPISFLNVNVILNQRFRKFSLIIRVDRSDRRSFAEKKNQSKRYSAIFPRFLHQIIIMSDLWSRVSRCRDGMVIAHREIETRGTEKAKRCKRKVTQAKRDGKSKGWALASAILSRAYEIQRTIPADIRNCIPSNLDRRKNRFRKVVCKYSRLLSAYLFLINRTIIDYVY